MSDKIKVSTIINADIKKVWNYYTLPEHITKWNFADPSWHCPWATNDMKIGGKYIARMEAKDGSSGFEFEAIYDEIKIGQSFTYSFADRTVNVELKDLDKQTEIIVEFDPENENPMEMQRQEDGKLFWIILKITQKQIKKIN
jgi:uncharacterized protein YndB with AHSA1/START domain